MQQVLVISYNFPPMGGVGVQRTLKFAKYLPEFGWMPHILTVHPPKIGLQDAALLNELPSDIAITRTPVLLPPQRLPFRMRNFITRWLLTVDEQAGWQPFAARAGARILAATPIKVIYSSSPPYTAHLIARQLHKQSHIPWVADFRDPWIGNFNLHFPTPLHCHLVERMERQVIREADHVLVVSPGMADALIARYTGISREKITCLPNGFDAQDFSAIQPIKKEENRFTLVYTGSFYAHGITADSILRAVELCVKTNRIPRQRMRVQLVGNTGKFTHRLIAELKLDDIVETPGFVAHTQSIACLQAADALLLVIGASPESSSVYTGKIFEYLAAGKPILCLANAGVAADLIREARAGVIVPPDDVLQISQCLADMYQQWQNGSLAIEPDQNLIQSFERRRQTGQLAGIFDRLTGESNGMNVEQHRQYLSVSDKP